MLTPRALAVFSKKRVLNEAIFGYSGDAYLFMWAKRALGAREVGAGPLAAVKDVAITSALAGNVATLLMLGLALSLGGGPAVEQAFSGAAMRPVGFGFAFVISISMGILLFSRKVMSLSARENFLIFLLHCGRLLAGSALLFLAGIRPTTRASSIGPQRARRLHGAIREVLAQAVQLGGSTLRDFCANKSLLPEGFMLFITGLIKLWTQGVDRLVKLKIPLTQLDCSTARTPQSSKENKAQILN